MAQRLDASPTRDPGSITDDPFRAYLDEQNCAFG
jgi:hypothetical protein